MCVTFALTKISTDPALRAATIKYIHANSYILIVSIMNLMELYTWTRRWSEVADFISSVPFCIAENPEQILTLEVEHYPNPIELPVTFCSSDHSFSNAELKEATEINLKTKVALFEMAFYRIVINILPMRTASIRLLRQWVFMQSNVLRFLFPSYVSFVEEQKASAQVINIESFKSAYIQALIIFLEYCVQKKGGKSPDIGDIYQLAIIPYVDFAVMDNERNDFFKRINQGNLFPEKLNTCNLAQSRKNNNAVRPLA
jgi:hypothetical protein